jgi:hypothetical protein
MKRRPAFLLLHSNETTGSVTRGAARKWFELSQLSDIKIVFLVPHQGAEEVTMAEINKLSVGKLLEPSWPDQARLR